jgi:hypothetical protein
VLVRIGDDDLDRPLIDVEWDNLGRSVRRSKSALRRYLLHNNLGHMPTLTFRHAPESLRGVGAAMTLFTRTLMRHGLDGPWLWVPEAGHVHGRLHVHMAVNWWSERGAVEVCERCATDSLAKVRSDVPPAGSLCIGCMWGHGFVGAPSEAVGDPRALAGYVSKYAAKSLGLVAGEQRHDRYHVRRGFQPEAVQWVSTSHDRGLRRLRELVGPGALDTVALHEIVEDWEAPPCFASTWELGEP